MANIRMTAYLFLVMADDIIGMADTNQWLSAMADTELLPSEVSDLMTLGNLMKNLINVRNLEI